MWSLYQKVTLAKSTPNQFSSSKSLLFYHLFQGSTSTLIFSVEGHRRPSFLVLRVDVDLGIHILPRQMSIPMSVLTLAMPKRLQDTLSTQEVQVLFGILHIANLMDAL